MGRLIIAYFAMGVVTLMIFSVADAMLGKRSWTKKQNVPFFPVAFGCIFLWWLVIAAMIHDIISMSRDKKKQKNSSDTEIARIIYERYMEVCASTDIKPLPRSGDWLDHYYLAMRLEDKEKAISSVNN